jgi:hypothetical protein
MAVTGAWSAETTSEAAAFFGPQGGTALHPTSTAENSHRALGLFRKARWALMAIGATVERWFELFPPVRARRKLRNFLKSSLRLIHQNTEDAAASLANLNRSAAVVEQAVARHEAAVASQFAALQKQTARLEGLVGRHQPGAAIGLGEPREEPAWQGRPFLREVLSVHSREEAKGLFAECVRLVEVELFSYCNRRCRFCPNSLYPRDGENKILGDDVFTTIVSNLAEIDYRGFLSFTRYSENLAHPNILFPRLNYARKFLPSTFIVFNTNGDYVTLPYLYALHYAGLDRITMQCYLNEKEFGRLADKKALAEKRIRKLGLKAALIKDTPLHFQFEAFVGSLRVVIEGYDFSVLATDRGGSLKIERPLRTAPCVMPMRDIYLNYDGSTSPCCDIRADVHGEDYVLGRIGPDFDLFQYFCSPAAVRFREGLLNFAEKTGACAHCTRDEGSYDYESVMAFLAPALQEKGGLD